MGKIILYYKYVTIEDPLAIQAWQRKLCDKLKLKGRIIIATEGINGTLGGSDEAVTAYQEAMEKHSLFQNIDFKVNEGGSEYFPRMRIVVKDEIVRLGIDPKKLTPENTGTYLSPEETHKLIREKKDKNLVILDTRNNYETRVGFFEDAVIPDIENFRDLPTYIDNNQELFKDKEVLMYCTGGVRCVRATAYLKSKNISKEVYHIQGGICRYIEKYPNGYFKGRNYVFDGRVTVKVNDTVVASCQFCQIPYDECENCVNATCNAQIIACPDCLKLYKNSCSATCRDLLEAGQVNMRTIPAQVKAK